MVLIFTIISFFIFWAIYYAVIGFSKSAEIQNGTLFMLALLNFCFIVSDYGFINSIVVICIFLTYYIASYIGWGSIQKIISDFFNGKDSIQYKKLNKFIAITFLLTCIIVSYLIFFSIFLKTNFLLTLTKSLMFVFTTINFVYLIYFSRKYMRKIFEEPYKFSFFDIIFNNFIVVSFIVSIYEPIDLIVFCLNYEKYKEFGVIYEDPTKTFDFFWLILICTILVIIPRIYNVFKYNKLEKNIED